MGIPFFPFTSKKKNERDMYFKNIVHLKSGGKIESTVRVNLSDYLNNVNINKKQHLLITLPNKSVWVPINNIAVIDSEPTSEPKNK